MFIICLIHYKIYAFYTVTFVFFNLSMYIICWIYYKIYTFCTVTFWFWRSVQVLYTFLLKNNARMVTDSERPHIRQVFVVSKILL
jgi:hypothetical protein